MPSSNPKEPTRLGKLQVKEREKRRVTTPLLLQMHMTECAAASLGSVLAYFGRWVPLAELRDRCEISRDGSTAAGIKRAAEYYGLECSGWFGKDQPNQEKAAPDDLVLGIQPFFDFGRL